MIDLVAIKARVSLAEVVGRGVPLKRSGRELSACCPFHQERSPSFYVDDDKGLWNCFGCGLGGDVFDYVMRVEGIDLPGAASLLEMSEWQPRIPAKAAKVAKVEADKIGYARRVWRQGKPVAGTPAQAYLEFRGIGAAQPGYLRFATLPYPELPGHFPVLLAAIQAVGAASAACSAYIWRLTGAARRRSQRPS